MNLKVVSYLSTLLLGCASFAQAQDIVQTAIDGGFNTLVAALTATDLAGAVAAPNGPFTVFAPTDEAFANLPFGILPALLSDDGLDTLAHILLYHVVGEPLLLEDIRNGERITTLQGDTVVYRNRDGDVINQSNIIAADIQVSNGVIHAIDAVLLFPDLELPPIADHDIVEIAVDAGFDTLVAAVSFAGLVGALEAEEPAKTVFAPTNEAFAALPEALLGFLLTEAGKPTLTDILLYHVVGAPVLASSLSDGQIVSTLLGETVEVSIDDGDIKINDSNVVVTDIIATNGVIHVIDAVLLQPSLFEKDIPGTAVAAGGFETLVAALTVTELAGAVAFPNGPFTVFAPTDDAFAALPAGALSDLLAPTGLSTLADILLYHVVSGVALADDLEDGDEIETLFGQTVEVSIEKKELFINDSEVIVADILTTNGVIHVIDAVLLFDGLVIPPAEDVEEPTQNIVEIAIAAEFDTLVAAVSFAGLVDALVAEEPAKTVFAPTNEAFAALPEDLLGFLLTETGKPTLTDILLYHVVGAAVLAGDLSDGQIVETLLGETVEVSIDGDSIKVNDSNVIITDIIATNGVIHVIDAVLLQPSLFTKDIPGTAIAAGSFETLVAALTVTELAGAVAFPNGPFTVFAPTDDAFAALPDGVISDLLAPTGLSTLADILLYHVVSGVALSTDLSDGLEVETLFGQTVEVSINRDGIFINDSEVIIPDIITTNGVVHAIDAVLLFDGLVIPPAGEVPEPTQNIVEIAIAAEFDTLVAAVSFAGLVDALVAEEPAKTVFAPTNEAFAALPEALLGFLLTETGKPTLTDILLYHVVGAAVLAGDLSDGQIVETLLGETVEVSIDGDSIKVNDSNVIITDILATNGVIHVIDAVLLQPSLFEKDIPGTAVAAGSFTTLVAALTVTELAGAVAFPNGPFTVFAPTDDAFAALPEGVIADLLAPTGLSTLADILLYHVVSGVALSTDLEDGQEIGTLFGQTVEVTIERRGGIFINKSEVIIPDIVTTNGVVHAIDAVLLFDGLVIPPQEPVEECSNIVDVACGTDDFSILCEAVKIADLAGALSGEGPLTVFAPTNQAFEELGDLLDAVIADIPLLTNILLFHVVTAKVGAADLVCTGTVEMANGQDSRTVCLGHDGVDGIFQKGGSNPRDDMPRIVATDIETCQGFIHVVDEVLLPGQLTPAAEKPEEEEEECQTIAEIACGLDDFSTLCSAVVAAGLADTLSGGSFTVFAPTNDAFANLGEDTLTAVVSDIPLLTDILLYHVVAGEVFEDDLSCTSLVEMVNGENTRTVCLGHDGADGIFQKGAGNPRTPSAMPRIVATDIAACNGVIHVVDEVILP